MTQEDPLERPVLPGLEPRKRGASPGDTAIASSWIVLEWNASSERAWMTVDKERVEDLR